MRFCLGNRYTYIVIVGICLLLLYYGMSSKKWTWTPSVIYKTISFPNVTSSQQTLTSLSVSTSSPERGANKTENQQPTPSVPVVKEDVDTRQSTIHDASPYYPSTLDKLWIEIDKGRTLVRRMAFYDTRPIFGHSVVILVLHDDEAEPNVPQLYARVVMFNGSQFCTRVKHWKKNGQIMRNWHEHIINHALRIDLKVSDGRPDYLQITKDQHCKESTLSTTMPVFYDKRERKNVFATCLQKALFNDATPESVVAFVELNRALGASYITMFLSNQLKHIKDIYKSMLPYINEGLVEVIDWRMKENIHEFGMAASATECIYRNIHRARFMSLHDIDEFLVPKKHPTWHGMIEDLKNFADISKYASLQFGNAFFSEKTSPVVTASKCKPQYIPIYFKRTQRNEYPEVVHPKVMVDLDTTITAYCHDIKNWYDGVNKELRVPKEIGMSFHYRNILGHRVHSVKKWVQDDVMKRYIDTIMPKIEKKFC